MLFTPSWFSIFEMILIVLLRSSMIFFYRKHILFFADERMGDKVDIHVDGPVDEFEVTLGHRRQVDGDIGYVHAFYAA